MSQMRSAILLWNVTEIRMCEGSLGSRSIHGASPVKITTRDQIRSNLTPVMTGPQVLERIRARRIGVVS